MPKGENVRMQDRAFMMTVNLAMFTVVDEARINTKRLPKKELTVLLMKRNRSPFQDCWQFPYGFVGAEESLDDAVCRELKEKTNLENLYFEQLYTWGAVNRDPTARVIATSYLAIAHKDQLNSQEIDHREELQWFSVAKKLLKTEHISELQSISHYLLSLKNKTLGISIDYQVVEDTQVDGFEIRTRYSYKLDSNSGAQMAYDHMKILDYALDRIKNKVRYTNIAFGFTPPLFTLTELQQVYEVLLGKQLIKSNFRQLIRRKVEKTQETKKAGAYRPSQLYRLKKSAMIEPPDTLE